MKNIFAVFAGLLISASSFAQAVTDSTEAASETEAKKRTTFTLAALYNTNASYYGRTADKAMPYVATAGSLRFPSGFYFNGMAYKLLDSTKSAVSASSAGAGFEFPIGKKLKMDLSYNHTFYPSNSSFIQAANADLASVNLTYNYWLSTGINFDYAFGKQQDLFGTFSNSKDITLGHLFSSSDAVTITPGVDIVGGTQRFYKEYTTEKRYRDSVAGFPLFPIWPPLGGSNNGGGGTTTETHTKQETRFELLAYIFKLPLAYSRASYMLEATYQLSVLGPKVDANKRNNSIFNLAFYYQF